MSGILLSKANSSVSALKEYKKSSYQVDGYRINANRIVNGERVGEDWLKVNSKNSSSSLATANHQTLKSTTNLTAV